MSARLARTLALGLVLAGCGPQDEDRCYQEGDSVHPDERVASAPRVGDLLEPYFGTKQGSLSWTTGGETEITFDFPYEAGAPYKLSTVYECAPGNVGYAMYSHVTTDDGSFDDEIAAGIHVRLRGTPRERETVIGFSGLSDWQWKSTLPEHFGIELERYASSHVHFELDWPPGRRTPAGGRLLFVGTLSVDAPTQDRIQVATLSF